LSDGPLSWPVPANTTEPGPDPMESEYKYSLFRKQALKDAITVLKEMEGEEALVFLLETKVG